MRLERVGFLVGVLPLLVPGLGSAAATAAVAGDAARPTVVARLEVAAAPDCATREALIARVASRSRRIRFVGDAATAPTLRATIGRGQGGASAVIGELAVLRPGGKRSSRRLTAPSCAEAVDALALVIALTLDPGFVADAPPSASAPPSAPPSAPALAAMSPTTASRSSTGAGGPATANAPAPRSAPSSQAESTRASAAPWPSEPPPSEPPPSPPSEPWPPSASAATTSRAPPESPLSPAPAPPIATARSAAPVEQAAVTRFGAGAAARAIWGVAPRAMPGLAVYASAALDRASIWSPALFLWAAHAATDDLVEPGGTAAFALDAVSLDACPLRLALDAVEARACGTGLLGRLSASGAHTFVPQSQARPFGTLGGSAIVTVTLGEIVQLWARFGAGGSLVRDAFEFAPEVFHRVSSVTLNLDLGLGIRFP